MQLCSAKYSCTKPKLDRTSEQRVTENVNHVIAVEVVITSMNRSTPVAERSSVAEYFSRSAILKMLVCVSSLLYISSAILEVDNLCELTLYASITDLLS